jgi:glycosyltransferase involved in cell wall biosynthesis
MQSMLHQTFRNFEFIVIDDASEDQSWKIIREFAKLDRRIIPYRNAQHLRATKTLNKGVKIAKGKYIVRMDADDWSFPNRLEKQFRFMEKHPSVGVSGGAIEICDSHLVRLNTRRYPLTDKGARRIIFRYSPFAHPATIWRKSVITAVGGYNENLPLSQDYELYFRMGKVSSFANMTDVILKLRTHADSSSAVRGRYQEQYALYSRIKAFLEYGYPMSFADKLYTFLQLLSMVIIPPKVKFWVFNWLRK